MIPELVSERVFQSAVIDLAVLRGWRVHHARAAQTAKGWRTPVQGHPGAPDLLLARSGVVLLRELKSQTGRATPEQLRWLTEAGDHAGLWRPSDWDSIIGELR